MGWFVPGFSGGSVAATYLGLKGQTANSDFRERFLIRNAEEDLYTSVNLVNITRLFDGGVIDDLHYRNTNSIRQSSRDGALWCEARSIVSF